MSQPETHLEYARRLQLGVASAITEARCQEPMTPSLEALLLALTQSAHMLERELASAARSAVETHRAASGRAA